MDSIKDNIERIPTELLEKMRLRLDKKITPGEYLQEFLCFSGMVAAKNIGMNRCALLLRDKESGRLQVSAVNDMDEGYKDFPSFVPHKEIEAAVIEKKKPVFIHDLSSQKKRMKKCSALLQDHGGSLLCVPLAAGDEVFGVLEYFSHKPVDPSGEAIEHIASIAYHMSAIIGDMALLGFY